MTGPHSQFGPDGREHRRVLLDPDRRHAELAMRRGRHFAAKRVGHQLHAVADAEHGHAGVEYRRLAARRRGLRHAAWPARQHDADGPSRANLRDRRVEGQDFGVDGQLPQPARNQLRELRSEIEDDDGLMNQFDRVIS